MVHDKPFILVADRDPFTQNILKKSLEEKFDIEFVEDGLELLERAKAKTPDIIILEVLLPTLDGFQVCKRLKNNPSTRNIPVIFFTLLLAEERAKQVGVDGFLLKPFNKGEFSRVIERFLVPDGKILEE